MEQRTQTAIRQSELCEIWSDGGYSFQLQIEAAALDQIKSEVIRGMKLLPKRGTEVGAILYGTIDQKAESCTVIVETVLHVSVQYRFGPSFRLSDEDREAFERAVHGLPSQTPIGWYRSNTRTQKDQTPEDEALTTRHFPSTCFFLLLRPDFNGFISATAYFAAHPPHEFDFARFSFLDQLLNEPAEDVADEERNPVVAPRAQLRPHAPHDFPVPPAPLLTPDEPERLSRLPLLLSIGGGVALLAAGAWFFVQPKLHPQNAASETGANSGSSTPAGAAANTLGLRAEYQGQGLMVRWNTDSPAIRGASNAEFILQQGPLRRTVPLDPATLLSGGLLLRPPSADLDLRLTVAGSGGNAVQTLRVLGLPEATQSQNTALVQPSLRKLNPKAAEEAAKPGREAVIGPIFSLSSPAASKPKPLPAGEESVASSSLLSTLPPANQTPSATEPVANTSAPASNGSSATSSALSAAALNAAINRDNAPKPVQVASVEPPPISAPTQSMRNAQVAVPGANWKAPEPKPIVPNNVPSPSATNASVPATNNAAPPATRNLPATTANNSATATPRNITTGAPTNTAQPPAPTVYTAPKPIRSVKAVPPGNLPIIKGNGYADENVGQTVEVEVSINEQGIVTGTRILKESGPFVRLFEKSATDAAKQWRFEPARSGVRSIPSTSRLSFHFSTPTR